MRDTAPRRRQSFWAQAVKATRGLAILTFTAVLFPFAATVCSLCYLLSGTACLLSRKPKQEEKPGKCILIIGGAKTKALHLGRLFKAEGYRVILADAKSRGSYVAGSFSRYVDAFYYLPKAEVDPEAYKAGILDIVRQHRPTLFVPMDASFVHEDSDVASELPEFCLPLMCDMETFMELDNKATFIAALKLAGIRHPTTRYVTSATEAYDILKGKSDSYVMKSIVYDNFRRVNIFPPSDLGKLEEYLKESGISENFPYVIQERLKSPERPCSCLIINGQILALTAGLYAPVCQTFVHEQVDDIEEWMQQFVALYPNKLTGWFTIDFLKSSVDGKYYPLECNPRLGSPFILFDKSDGVIKRLESALGLDKNSKTVQKPTDNNEVNSTSNLFVTTSEPAEADELDPHSPIAPSTQLSGGRYGAKWNHITADQQSTSSNGEETIPTIQPSRTEIYWLMNVLWVLLTNLFNPPVLKRYLRKLVRGTEAVFMFTDPMPFLALNFFQIPYLIVTNLVGDHHWNTADYCICALRQDNA